DEVQVGRGKSGAEPRASGEHHSLFSRLDGYAKSQGGRDQSRRINSRRPARGVAARGWFTRVGDVTALSRDHRFRDELALLEAVAQLRRKSRFVTRESDSGTASLRRSTCIAFTSTM